MGNNQNQDQEYGGEYKVEISDKGRVSFNLNYKWVIGISLSIFSFVFYLVIDKYHFQPLNRLEIENVKLADKNKSMEGTLKILAENQKLLLDRSERVEQWMINNLPVFDINTNHTKNTLKVDDSTPGNVDGIPNNEIGPK